ncbi:MAG: winged helix-turn-helix transcriptional regulator, partial [Sulfurifustaceae bacterium]
MNRRENKDERRLLELLDVVGQKSDVSQRHLARHLGVALGLANSYLRRCVRKGWIKISTAPANRYLYYLTPKGFSEKSRLTAKYLSTS